MDKLINHHDDDEMWYGEKKVSIINVNAKI